MTANARFIALIKPKPDGRIDYFGPFVSEARAFDFLEAQPDPLPGGFKLCKPLLQTHVS